MRTMRSRNIHLVLLASTSLAVAGCDNAPKDQQAPEATTGEALEEPVTIVEPGHCAETGLNADGSSKPAFSPEACAEAEREALAEFENTAPLYDYREDCIAQHGEDACRGEMRTVQRDGQARTGYMPAFAGFVVGTAATLAAAHIFHTLQGNATGRIARPVPVYATRSETCRSNPNAQGCRSGTGGSSGGRAGYTYGYRGHTVAEPGTAGRMTTTVIKTRTGGLAPYSPERGRFPGFGPSTAPTGAQGSAQARFGTFQRIRSFFASGTTAHGGTAVGATARGGFGGSAGSHGSGGGGHGGS